MIGLLLVAALAQTPAHAQTPAYAQTPGVDAARRIVGTLQLAAQEYALAFKDGVIVLPAEWEEAKLFVAEASKSAASLPANIRGPLAPRLAALERRLANRMPPESLMIEARDIERTLTVAIGVSLDERPAREPSIASGEVLYRSTCARCHGDNGRGDGPAVLATRMDPPPSNFTDTALLAGTSPLDLYRKVTLGVPGTRMQPFGEALSREERWDLVAYLLTFTDAEARRGRNGQVAVVFGSVRSALVGALALADRGEKDAAARQVFDAYMAFEAVEGSLAATDPAIVTRAEGRFTSLRMAAATGDSKAALDKSYQDLLASLVEAESALTTTRSQAGMFVESLLLMLREGFEAILVIGAIMAVLIKAGAKERQRNVRWGIAAALVASLATAAVLEIIFAVTPAQREALEGGIMLVAAATLFYVSYWLVSKIEIVAWTRFVKGQIQKAVESGSGLALAGVAFLAVYREGFETVLFYKALYVSGGAGSGPPVTAGIVAGLAVLVLVFIGIEKFGLKVPMRPFFAVTGATLAWMAFVFAGRGVKELQEGSIIGSTLLPWAPRNDFLGIYPTLESLAVQAAILLAILLALIWTFVIVPRRLRAHSGDVPPSMNRPSRPTGARKTTSV